MKPSTSIKEYYNGRTSLRLWHEQIADWLIANPGGTYKECAAFMGRHAQTVGLIISSDLFKTYLEKRREEFKQTLNEKISSKMSRAAELSLDVLIDALDKKKDRVPMQMLDHGVSMLDRLGYTTKPNGPVLAINNTQNVLVAPPISHSALVEAQDALRLAEQLRASRSREAVPLRSSSAEPAFLEPTLPDESAEGGAIAAIETPTPYLSDIEVDREPDVARLLNDL